MTVKKKKKVVAKKKVAVKKKVSSTKKKVSKKKAHITKNYLMMVLDESGSMASMKLQAISAFNEQIETVKKNRGTLDVSVGLVKFSSTVQDVYTNVAIDSAESLTLESYNPGGGTAMYDGVGHAIENLLAQSDINDENVNVLMLIISDGEENSSRKYTSASVGEKIQELQKTKRWTFTYAGANQDLSKIQTALNIPAGNTMLFAASAAGMKSANATRSLGTQAFYSTTLNAGAGAVNSFYSDVETKAKS